MFAMVAVDRCLAMVKMGRQEYDGSRNRASVNLVFASSNTTKKRAHRSDAPCLDNRSDEQRSTEAQGRESFPALSSPPVADRGGCYCKGNFAVDSLACLVVFLFVIDLPVVLLQI